MTDNRQLELPFSSAEGTLAAPNAPPVVSVDAPGDHLTIAAVPIPRRCPVTGGRTCYRDGCTHYHREHGGRCSHPEPVAAARSRPRSRRR